MPQDTHLLQLPRHRERPRPVKHPDIVKTQKASAEQIPAVGILSVHPPEQRHELSIKINCIKKKEYTHDYLKRKSNVQRK